MSTAVEELQKDILENRENVSTILRKAHVIAFKLKLVDFDDWIKKELDGYGDYSSIPEYRRVYGETVTKTPNGYITVSMSSEMAKVLNTRKILESIPKIEDMSKKDDKVSISVPTEVAKELCKNTGFLFPCYFVFGTQCLVDILGRVKNALLDWCLKLESDGIEGKDFKFNDEEIQKAKEIKQQIIYNGPVYNGNINSSQLIYGNNNKIELTLDEYSKLAEKVKKEIQTKDINKENKDCANELLTNIETTIQEKKKSNTISCLFIGLRDFLVNIGESVIAAIITSKLFGL